MAEDGSLKKFSGAMQAFGDKIFFRGDLLKTSNALSESSNQLQEKQVTLLEELVGLTRSHLDFAKEVWADQERQDDLVPPTPEPKDDTKSDAKIVPASAEMPSGLSMLGALALAPFAFKFAKAFVSTITDGLVDLTAAGIIGLSAMLGRPIKAVLSRFGKAFSFIKDLSKGASRIGKVVGNFARGLGKVASFVGKLFGKIPGVGVLKVLLGRLAWPITVLLGVVEAVKSFRDKEGSIFEKIGAGIGGFLASVVGAPLDLLKGMVAWILKKVGFDEASELLSGFSFSELIRSIYENMFASIQAGFDWLTSGKALGDTVSFLKDLWNTFLDGASDFGSWIYSKTVEPVMNWFKGIFNMENITAATDWFGNLIDDTVETVKNWFKSAFDFFPSLAEIKESLTAMLPEWMRPDNVEEKRADLLEKIAKQEALIAEGDLSRGIDGFGKSREAIIEELRADLSELTGLNEGGIINAPKSGAIAMLHGQEAVIPLDSPTAANKINAIAEGSSRMASAMINNIAPTQISNGGNMSNSNNSNTTIVNNSVDAYRSLDPALAR